MPILHRVALVGLGGMGAGNHFDPAVRIIYSHLGAILNHPGRVQLAAIVDTDATRLAEIGNKLRANNQGNGFTQHPTLEEAVAFHNSDRTPIDIVCCAAGPQANAEVITMANALGIRAVYCDKPLSLSLAEADRLVEIANRDRLLVQVNYLRNFDTCHRNIVEYIKAGKLGTLLYCRALYKGGVMAVAPHTFALLAMLFGKPLWVSGTYSSLINGRAPDDPNINGTLRYAFGPDKWPVDVSLTATGRGLRPDGSDLKNNTYVYEFEFTGTEGRLSILESGTRVRLEEMRPGRIFGPLGETMPYDTAYVPSALQPEAFPSYITEAFGHLLDALDNGTQSAVSAALARDAEEVSHALVVSAMEDGATMRFPLIERHTHVFKQARAGVDLLKKEAGVK